MARILIGTSGWHYASWRGPFFPDGLPLARQLQYYASQFATTELNGVFYRTPSREAVRSWRDQTGNDFVFAWKASKFITHWKRLSAASENSLALLEDRLRLLGDKAGPVLFQLPPQFEADTQRLAAFLTMLPGKRRYSFEFRHPSWYAPAVLRLLRDANVALCLSDHHDAPAPWKRTADFVYIRGHGPGGRYRGLFGSDAGALGRARAGLEAAAGRRVCLFRQRPEERGAHRCAAAAQPHCQAGNALQIGRRLEWCCRGTALV